MLLCLIFLSITGQPSVKESFWFLLTITLSIIFLFLSFRELWRKDKSESKNDIILMHIASAERDIKKLNVLLENKLINQQEYDESKREIESTLEKNKQKYRKIN